MPTFVFHQVGEKNTRYIVTPDKMDWIWQQMAGNSVITYDDGYLESVKYLLEKKSSSVLKRKVIIFIVADLAGNINNWDRQGELAGQRLADWDLIKEVYQKGIEIGSHGRTHEDLRKMTDNQLWRELKGSKEVIEERINAPVESFAYPYGLYDDRVIKFVKKAGYLRAYTTCDSWLPGFANPYRRRRIEIRGTDSDILVRLKLSCLYDLKAVGELPVLLCQKILCLRSGK